MIEPHITSNSVLSPYGSTEWTRQTRFVLWAGSGQAYAPGACPTVLSYPSTRQSHWKCLSGFGEAPARLPVDLPDFREFPLGVAIPGNSREFPTPETLLPGNWPTIVYIKVCLKSLNNILTGYTNKQSNKP